MDVDYEKLGFMAGLEIHQELNTRKLFCNCKTSMKEEEKDTEVFRKLRSVVGETGEKDVASAYEELRNRKFTYHGYKGEYCLVDLDEEPPHNVDKEAFNISLGVAKLFGLVVPDNICVMRKTVTDGSAVSGFQRTMLVGMEGEKSYLETSQGLVKINQLNLEEDSCSVKKKEGNTVTYSLSRLGVPLLEIGTDPSLKNPEHVKEAALKLGTLLRSFNVKRGIGTIRQDVNISISGGARIEVKGWQDIKKLEDLVKNEVLRQYNLLEFKKELSKKGLRKFKRDRLEATETFKNTKSKIILDLIKNGGKVYGLKLPKFSGFLKRELCLGKTFGKELSEYAKAYGTKGMIHTDEDLKKYKLESEFNHLKRMFNAGSDDAVIIVAEQDEIAKKAINSVYERALYVLTGVPEETRIPNHDNATTSYARPLPGSHRMYPETDVLNIRAGARAVKEIEIPELLPDKIKRFIKEYIIDEATAKEIISKGYKFEKYIEKYSKIEPKYIASFLVEIPKEIKKRYKKDIKSEDYIDEIFAKLSKEEVSREAVFEILVELSHGKKVDYTKFKKMSDSDLRKEIKQIIKENPNVEGKAMIGKVMGKLRGKADGKKIVELLGKLQG